MCKGGGQGFVTHTESRHISASAGAVLAFAAVRTTVQRPAAFDYTAPHAAEHKSTACIGFYQCVAEFHCNLCYHDVTHLN